MSELLYCTKCRKEYDAHTEDLGTYFCPTCQKPKLPDYEQLDAFVKSLFAKAMRERDEKRNNKQ